MSSSAAPSPTAAAVSSVKVSQTNTSATVPSTTASSSSMTTVKEDAAWWNTTKALAAGATAGALSRSVTSPLERLKVMKQVQSGSTKYSGGIISALGMMYREEGIRGWWKGNGTNVARIAPFSAIQFCTFDIYKGLIVGDDPKPGFIKTFAAGAATGMTASTICYPLDLVRSVLSVQTTSTHYTGIGHAMRCIVKQDGLIGLYRGLGPTLCGIAPYVAINMSVFDVLRRHYAPSKDAPYAIAVATNLSMGACAGFVAAAITYPTDLIRRRMQLQGMQGGHDLEVYNSTLDCIKKTVKKEGVSGLYKGLGACFLKVVPSMAIAFATYEGLRTVWGFDPSKVSKPPSGG